MAANGHSPVGNVSKVFILILYCCTQLTAQNPTSISIQDALLEVAKAHKLSLVFNADNIPDRKVEFPKNVKAATQLDAIFRNTNLEYRIDSNQIFLYVKRSLYGYIEDAISGERLVAATIYFPEDNEYAVANEQGYFSFQTIKDSVAIEVSYLGFSLLKITLGINEMDRPIVLKLQADTNLKEVIISDLATSAIDQNYIELNKGTDILLHQNQAVSAIGGEPDIFQAMMRQTGVNAGTDGVGGMHVRGGKNDQNLILYDGVKMYNSSHAFGAFSSINAGVVDQARLHKSGASGAFFGRLSSILDVRTKDPNLSLIKASAQVSTIASQGTIELPIIKDRLGVMVTGRRTHIDAYIKAKSSDSKLEESVLGETNYNFNDINVKALAKINARHRLYLTAYHGQDRYDDDDFKDDYFYVNDFEIEGEYEDQIIFYDWKNQFASLRYNLLLGSQTIVNLQLSSYQYLYRSFFEWDYIFEDVEEILFARDYRDFTSGIKHNEARLDFQMVSKHHHFSYGITYGRKNYNLGELTLEGYDEEPDPIDIFPLGDFLYTELIGNFESDELSLYLSDKYKINNDWLLEGGFYFSLFNSHLKDVVDERDPYSASGVHGYLKTLYQFNKHVSFGATVGSYLQTEHLLTTSDNGYPNDIWIPATLKLPAERSNQMELFVNMKSANHNLRISGYYKRQENILFYDTIRTLPTLTEIESDFLEDVLVTGVSDGYGLELNYSYQMKGKFAMNAAYTFSKNDYQFDQVNNGAAFPFDYSIPHTFSLGSNVYLSEKWTLSLDWYYASGKPYTLYSSLVEFSPIDRDVEFSILEPVTDNYNDQRLPSSHKLSFSLSTFWEWRKTRNDFSFGIQNVYNRKNVIYQYNLEGEGIQQQLGFSLLPMLRWRVSI